MEFMTDPMGIENRSMDLIRPYLEKLGLSEAERLVYSRMIHAAGDPDYANHVALHPQAIEAALAAIEAGASIYCDVEMVRTGINRRQLAKFGGEVHCLIGDATVAAEAKKLGITRSMVAMRTFGAKLNGSVVAIGNAPTALFEVLRLMREEGVRPACIIGIPVGFVGAAESKEALIEQSPVPYITVRGTKGGSPIAASVVNAIQYLKGR